MYKQIKIMGFEDLANCIVRIVDEAYIPFDPANTDFVQFKKDVLEGAELQDADGNVMTPDEAMIFISNLP